MAITPNVDPGEAFIKDVKSRVCSAIDEAVAAGADVIFDDQIEKALGPPEVKDGVAWDTWKPTGFRVITIRIKETRLAMSECEAGRPYR